MLPSSTKRVFRCAAAVAALAADATSGLSAEATPAGRLILSEKPFWRKHHTFFPPSLSVKAAEAAGLPADAESRARFFAKAPNRLPSPWRCPWPTGVCRTSRTTPRS